VYHLVLSSLLLSVFVVFTAGCYNPNHFRGDHATMLAQDYWSSPRYRILFEGVEVEERASVSFEFGNAPPIEMYVCLDLDDEDLAVLIEHEAEIAVSIIDQSNGMLIYQERGELKPECRASDDWGRAAFVARRPPAWEEIRDATVVELRDPVKLRRGRTYEIRLEVFLDEPLPASAKVRLLLAGGFRSVL
jgi:hypothetical protein